ncbi:MAG: competence/damage-inducible protein A, partial [Bacillota bacterium]|nr:competence/damage-inducible protein A [Bacillota bacterium]
LFGQITNTNTVYLSQKLNALGIDVMYHYTVGDNPKRLAEMIETSFKDCDLVITTGGLGPTQDDMTKEIACQIMGDHLVMHEDILEAIKERIFSYKKTMTKNNIKQAEMPSRCRVFYNDAGTAPGFALDRAEADGSGEKQWIACMPGPPKEMTRMFEKSVQPWLEELAEGCLFYKEIRTFGVGESDLETMLLPVIDGQTDPTVATYAKSGESMIRVASKRKTAEEAKAAVEEMIGRINELCGQYIYSYDGDDYAQVVGKLLIERGLSISCAESCTGGMFAAALTDTPGISAVFDRGLVTYSNQAKIDELGVKPETLEKYGAVSRETALEMAEGVRHVSGSDIGISVTGIAGPDGGTEEKPVGLTYIGISYGDKLECREIHRTLNDRARNRNFAVLTMFDVIYRNI